MEKRKWVVGLGKWCWKGNFCLGAEKCELFPTCLLEHSFILLHFPWNIGGGGGVRVVLETVPLLTGKYLRASFIVLPCKEGAIQALPYDMAVSLFEETLWEHINRCLANRNAAVQLHQLLSRKSCICWVLAFCAAFKYSARTFRGKFMNHSGTKDAFGHCKIGFRSLLCYEAGWLWGSYTLSARIFITGCFVLSSISSVDKRNCSNLCFNKCYSYANNMRGSAAKEEQSPRSWDRCRGR